MKNEQLHTFSNISVMQLKCVANSRVNYEIIFLCKGQF